MQSGIEIYANGQSIELVERKVIKKVDADAFIRKLAETTVIASGILPPGCRLYAKRGNCTVYAIEVGPRPTNINFLGKPYMVSMPYLMFYFVVREVGKRLDVAGVYLSCAKLPYRDEKDRAFIAPLPNIFSAQGKAGVGHICTGGMRYDTSKISLLVNSFIQAYFGSGFNRDLTIGVPKNSGTDEGSHSAWITKWAEDTEKNPMIGIAVEGYEYATHPDKTPIGIVNQLLTSRE